MFARIVSGEIALDKLEEAIHQWQEVVGPSAQQQRGFRNARLVADRTTGQIASMGLWATEADMLDSIQWNQEQVATFAGLFTAPPTIRHYELIADVSPP